MDDVTQLLEALPAGVRATADLLDRAKLVDKHYLPARYPNGFAVGTPRCAMAPGEAGPVRVGPVCQVAPQPTAPPRPRPRRTPFMPATLKAMR